MNQAWYKSARLKPELPVKSMDTALPERSMQMPRSPKLLNPVLSAQSQETRRGAPRDQPASSPVPAAGLWVMTPPAIPCDRWGAPRPREGQTRGEVKQCRFISSSGRRRRLWARQLCSSPPLPPPSDGQPVPSAQQAQQRFWWMKKNSSVHKSLLLLSPSLAPTGRAFWRERKESTGQTGQNAHRRKQR